MATSSEIIVDDLSNKPSSIHKMSGNTVSTDSLAAWVMERVGAWRRYRDQNFKDLWGEYYRIWRGIWSSSDRTRKSERSRIISPALQQAIESTVSELEESTFGRLRWIDIQDDRLDMNKEDVELLNKQLLEDFELDGIKSAISETYLNGALYGIGIGKIVVEETKEFVLDPNTFNIPGMLPAASQKNRISVKLIAVDPNNFVIEPIARTVNEALGCAHEMVVPRHVISLKQEEGIYNKGDFGIAPSSSDQGRDAEGVLEFSTTSPDEEVKITEYHGLIPVRYLERKNKNDSDILALFDAELEEFNPRTIDGEELVEAIVTIANDSFELKAVENPHIMKDRSIIAYQHDTVPNRFYGRGVAEKGYNSQKALDAEIRARIDGLGFSNNPMIAVDVGSLPRGQNSGMSVYPGKTIITNGSPRDSIFPIQFPGPDPNTYRQTGELERMIQMGTGSMDSATPVGISPRNQTASGMSMMLAGAIKRQKRTMHNIERHFLDPLVKKSLWRYMDFDPERYPVQDYKFIIHSSMGIMAREFEQQQLSSLLNTVPPNSPAYWLILDSIYENSSLTNKEQARELIQEALQNTLEPPKPEDSPQFQLKMKELELKEADAEDNMFLEAQTHKRLMKEADTRAANSAYNLGLELQQNKIDLEKEKSNRLEAESRSILNIAKAESEQVGTQIKQYTAQLAQMQNKIEQNVNILDNFRHQVQTMLGAIGDITTSRMGRDKISNMNMQTENVQPQAQTFSPPMNAPTGVPDQPGLEQQVLPTPDQDGEF